MKFGDETNYWGLSSVSADCITFLDRRLNLVREVYIENYYKTEKLSFFSIYRTSDPPGLYITVCWEIITKYYRFLFKEIPLIHYDELIIRTTFPVSAVFKNTLYILLAIYWKNLILKYNYDIISYLPYSSIGCFNFSYSVGVAKFLVIDRKIKIKNSRTFFGSDGLVVAQILSMNVSWKHQKLLWSLIHQCCCRRKRKKKKQDRSWKILGY